MATPNPLSHELLIASLTIQRASLATKKVLATIKTTNNEISKADSTPVTIADFAAQALIISAIHHAFPEDSFIGEEDSSVLRQDTELCGKVWELVKSTKLNDEESEALLKRPQDVEEMMKVIDLGGWGVGGQGRVWMLDPVDGTATFLKGQQYAVCLALVENGKEVLGVIGCPNLKFESSRVEEEDLDESGWGCMLSAVKGEGAFRRPMGESGLQPAQKLEKEPKAGAGLATLEFVDSSMSKSTSHESVHRVAEKIGANHPGAELWSSQMRYIALILGSSIIQVRIPPQKIKTSFVWDHAGGQLILAEVGGKVTDVNGKNIDFGLGRNLAGNWGMIASREGVHERLLAAVDEILKL
ncbi:hypothetical protein HYALB_00007466 [Hymenoscyphus albidus]|uniref:3'(2'),5'-bisphosphate nucleotidase n=1 Tax=Hymenoscyphus albidus TaxID=595503 RepID=A0A9N9LHN6_9HELO|nr:hypothetical protein HYALB_00007466 [Hymenoscyphus albidus]